MDMIITSCGKVTVGRHRNVQQQIIDGYIAAHKQRKTSTHCNSSCRFAGRVKKASVVEEAAPMSHTNITHPVHVVWAPELAQTVDQPLPRAWLSCTA